MLIRYLPRTIGLLLEMFFISSMLLLAIKLYYSNKDLELIAENGINFQARFQETRIIPGINGPTNVQIQHLDLIKYKNRACQSIEYKNESVIFTDNYVSDTTLYPGLLADTKPIVISMNTYGYPQMFKSLSQVRAQHRECERFYNDTQQTFTVFHNILRVTYTPRYNDVTLLAQLTVDRMDRLEKLMTAWPGPFSVVIYIYKHCLSTFIEDIKQSKIYKRSNVFLHLAVPHKYLDNVAVDYPVSMLRNMALRGARTDFVLYIDVDFVPNPDAYYNIRLWLGKRTVTDKIAYIIPGFDVKRLSSTKEKFIQDIISGEAYLFHVKGFPAGHQPTDVTRWIQSNTSYEVQYKDCFEPFCVFPRRILPAYPEIIAGRQRDKITQVRALFELGYRFIVLPDAFIMHIDHPRPLLAEQKDMIRCAKKVYDHLSKNLEDAKNASESFSVINHPPQL